MSRTGKQPINIPDKVKVSCVNGLFLAEGPLGKEEVRVHALASVAIHDKQIDVTRIDESKLAKGIHGLTRALLNNAVVGVSQGFRKDLEIHGVGYKAEIKGDLLKINVGFSHIVDFKVPKGIKIVVADQTKVAVSGSSKELVGRVSANIRSVKPPEPYKAKGIKYAGEVIARKVGKAAGGK